MVVGCVYVVVGCVYVVVGCVYTVVGCVYVVVGCVYVVVGCVYMVVGCVYTVVGCVYTVVGCVYVVVGCVYAVVGCVYTMSRLTKKDVITDCYKMFFLLNGCHLSERCCEALASVLSSNSSSLRELDLSTNDVQDSGVKLLSAGLGSPHCTLETLRLSGCLVTQEGCASLASALSSNPSHLRELDLSYNHPGDSGVTLLSAGLEDPRWRLDTLRVEHGGVWRLKPGVKKYACELTLDPNTAHRVLSLSEDNRKVTLVRKEQSYPDHPERFDSWPQVLCREALTGRCYWEVEWEGGVFIGVTYRGITRRGGGYDSWLGGNNKSWSLVCDDDGYSAWYNGSETDIRPPPPGSNRVGVYLDRPAGTLSFYRVSPDVGGSSDTLTHIHTFQSTFTQEDLLPGFRLWGDGASMSLCQL
ncbi:unnamed protein product [Lota lota]